MTQDSTDSGHPDSPSPFQAAVDAAFAAPGERASQVPQAAIAALRDLINLLREAPLDRPSNAMRTRAERLIVPDAATQSDLASLLRRWLEAARQVAMELVGPATAGGGLMPSLPGFRGAAAPIRTYRAATPSASTTPALEAWLDLQIDRLAQGSRLRGQITCEGETSPLMAHLFAGMGGELLASAAIAADGTFVVSTDAAEVTVAIELDGLETALIVGSVVLRTEQVGG